MKNNIKAVITADIMSVLCSRDMNYLPIKKSIPIPYSIRLVPNVFWQTKNASHFIFSSYNDCDYSFIVFDGINTLKTNMTIDELGIIYGALKYVKLSGIGYNAYGKAFSPFVSTIDSIKLNKTAEELRLSEHMKDILKPLNELNEACNWLCLQNVILS